MRMLSLKKIFFIRRIKSTSPLFFSTFYLITAQLITSPEVFANSEVKIYNDFSVTHNSISGPGKDQSSLTNGGNFLEILSINGKGKVGEFDYRFTLGGKATDDPRNDVQDVSLTNLQAHLSNDVHSFNAGDTFESFSQYTLNSAVKGASYRYANKQNNLPDITFVYGLDQPRWDNFWDLDVVKRDVYGTRIQQNINDDFWMALNTVITKDKDRLSTESLFDTETYSLDWEYLPIKGLTLRGESAFNKSEESIFGIKGSDEQKGSAHHIEAIGDGGPSRVEINYERVSPDYLSLLGSATPDREKTKLSWRYKYSKTLTMNLLMLWYRDNLDDNLAFRTDHFRPELSISKRQIFQRRYATADISYKFDRAIGGDSTTNVSTKDSYLNVGYRDKFGSLDSDSNLGFIFYDGNPSRDSDEAIYNTTLSARQTMGDLILKPSLRLGGWTLQDDLSDSRDQIWEYSLGLGLDIPKQKITSNLRVGQNRLLKETGDDSQKAMASLSMYYRPDFLSSFEYSQIYLRAFINDFSYSTSNRDFSENSVTAGVIVRL